MSDQLIDALVGVLPALVRGNQIRIERSNALSTLGERDSQSRIFLAELVVRFNQRRDRALEPIKVTGV